MFGEYLLNAQGEDVVAGIRTPQDIQTLYDQMPDVHQAFVKVTKQLEAHYKDMQDIEFTIENGKLYLLQTRNGKRTAKAAVKIAVDLANEGLITQQEAMRKVDVKAIDQLLHPNFDDKALEATTISTLGLPASPGLRQVKSSFLLKMLKYKLFQAKSNINASRDISRRYRRYGCK